MIYLHEPFFSGKEKKYVKSCLDQGWVSTAGKYVDLFEKKVANYTGAKYAIACINGTSALQISLKLADLKENDEVIVPSMTFIAPVNAISYNQSKPIFMDCDEYYTIDINKTIEFLKRETHTIKKRLNSKYLTVTINKKTRNQIRAIIVVHVFGNAVKLEKLLKICRKKNITLIEDAAESIGTFYKLKKNTKKHTGTLGRIGCLSFNGNKIITTGGGGMILTNSRKIAKRAKYLITQAKDDPIFSLHHEVGYNFRLPNILAALGLAQLESLSKFIKKKNVIHKRYKKKLNNIKHLSVSNVPNYAESNYWLNILKINKKISKEKLKKIIKSFRKSNIEVRPLWHPNHLQKQYKNCQTYKLSNTNNRGMLIPTTSSITIA